MKIAVEGCCHGELDKIYETITYAEKRGGIKVDLLLICGDFQSVRNLTDLQAMAVPDKYKLMNTFWKYYSGEKMAPVLTVFIGGNHEASNYLQELPYGGWVAPNIYYMGYAGVLNFGGVRIAGLSGIYKARDYHKGRHEHPPYNSGTVRSVYHYRQLEVFRLSKLKEPVDIMLSHDWPQGIYNYGNVNALLWKKPFLREEVEQNILGSAPLEQLLHHMQPKHWFAAHLHVKFAAKVQHETTDGSIKMTNFLSLDKCLPKRQFLQIIDLPGDPSLPQQLQLDPEWLGVLKRTNHFLHFTWKNQYLPTDMGSPECYPSAEDRRLLEEDFGGNFAVPPHEGFFTHTAPVHNPKARACNASQPKMIINPQTTLLCQMLEITDPFAMFKNKETHSIEHLLPSSPGSAPAVAGDDSALLDSSVLSDDDARPSFIDSTLDTTVDTTLNTTSNPDEISLESSDEEQEGGKGEGKVGNGASTSTSTSSSTEDSDGKGKLPQTSSPIEDRMEQEGGSGDAMAFMLHTPAKAEGGRKDEVSGTSTPPNISLPQPKGGAGLSPLSPLTASTPLRLPAGRHQSLTGLNQSATSMNQSVASMNQSVTSMNQSITSMNQSLSSVNQSVTSMNLSLTSTNQSPVATPNSPTGLKRASPEPLNDSVTGSESAGSTEPTTGGSTGGSSSQESPAVKKQKFKRRNQSFYSSADEESAS